MMDLIDGSHCTRTPFLSICMIMSSSILTSGKLTFDSSWHRCYESESSATKPRNLDLVSLSLTLDIGGLDDPRIWNGTNWLASGFAESKLEPIPAIKRYRFQIKLWLPEVPGCDFESVDIWISFAYGCFEVWRASSSTACCRQNLCPAINFIKYSYYDFIVWNACSLLSLSQVMTIY